MNSRLNEAIYDRYILPVKRKKTDKIGLEFEFPIVNLQKKPADFSLVHRVTESFTEDFSFTEIKRDDDGQIYMAREPDTGDILSYDCSYNTLELSFGTETNLHTLYRRFQQYYNYLQGQLGSADHMLTGMGINPGYRYNRNIPVVNERYRMLYHHLCSYKNYGKKLLFHDHPDFGLFSCASQVQLDVDQSILVEVLNTFTQLEPLKALLFANSLWKDDDHEYLCARDFFWRNSMHGLNRHNVDMYEVRFESVDEVIRYIKSMSMYCVLRDGKYIHFTPIPLTDYFAADKIEGEVFDGTAYQKTMIHPQLDDLQYLRSFKFDDLTFRGTVEFRSVCEQPVSEIMASGAFHAGLMKNLHALTELLVEDEIIYHKGYNASELRRMFVKPELPGEFSKKKISRMILSVLELARQGLEARGQGEEVFLAPLYERAENLLSPAKEMKLGMEQGKDIDYYICLFGENV